MADANDIDLIYEYVGGAHLLWSKDPRARGLCVANRDLQKAFKSASHQLNVLAKVHRGVDAGYVPSVPAPEFEAWVKDIYPRLLENKPASIIPTLSSVMPWHKIAA